MKDIRVINWMRTIRSERKVNLDLINLHRIIGGIMYYGRPEMLKVRMRNGQCMQIFRGGTTQILGRVTLREAQKMRRELLGLLPRDSANCQLLRQILLSTKMQISNIVIHARLKMVNSLTEIAHSNENLSFDIELFPAALIRQWEPAHVAVFHNGKIIITGLKTVSRCREILISLEEFLKKIYMQQYSCVFPSPLKWKNAEKKFGKLA